MEGSTQPRCDVDDYEIRPSPDKGLGAFAVKEIPSGSLILAESPTIILMQEPLSIRDADIEAALLTLSPFQRDSFHTLSAPPTQYESELQRKFLGNSMSPSAIPGSTCLCLRIARFNHSCRPNSEMAWNPFTRTFDLYAIRTIERGEEILWNYVPGSNYMPKSYRQFVQFLNWRFVCNCEFCEGMTAEWRIRNDRTRERMYLLQKSLQGFELSALGLDAIAARGIDVESTWKPGELEAILENLWQPPTELPDELKDMDVREQFHAYNELAAITEAGCIIGKELAMAGICVVNAATRQSGLVENDDEVKLVDEHMAMAMRTIYASRPRSGPDVQAFEGKREDWETLREAIVLVLDYESGIRNTTDHEDMQDENL